MSEILTPFAAYLKVNGVDAEQAAQALNKTKAYIHMLIAGKTPSLHLAAVIEHWSGGSVPMQSWPDWKTIRKKTRPLGKAK